MSPPVHVKAIVAFAQSLFLAIGIRDLVATGTPLPLPDEEKLMKMFEADSSMKSSAVFRSEGAKMFFGQLFGCFITTVALVKMTAVFTNLEGTFLRRNLFITLGLCDWLTAGTLLGHDAFFMSSFDVTVKPFIGIMAVEGAVLLFDALFRERSLKSAAKKKK